MTHFNITTQTFGEGGLLPLRRCQIANKTFDTPAKAIPISRTRSTESISGNSREVAELYAQVDTRRLRDGRHDPDLSIADRLGFKEAQRDEVVFTFLSYQDGHAVSPVEAEQMTNITAATGDFITVPLQPSLLRSVEPENGLEDSAYQSYRHGVERCLQAALEHSSNLPVVGVLPLLGMTYMTDLLELYGEFGIRAFCLNFDRKRITAGRQVGLMQPLANYLATRGLEEDVLLYGINLNPKDRELIPGVYPAANFAAVGLGVDIVGETHVPPKGPPEMFEPPEGEEPVQTFRLFDKDALVFRESPIPEIPYHWPGESGISVERVMKLADGSPQSRSRLQALVNAEQMSIAFQLLREALNEDEVVEFLANKEGITPDIVDAFAAVRSSFDSGREQSGLSDFS